MMEFVGRAVKKEFKGRGIHSGVVKSFDSSSGFFEVEFEGGDSEELDLSEVSLLLDGQSQPVEKRPCRGRKPKKRRRIESKCEIGGASANAGRSLVLDKGNPDETLEMGFEVSVLCVKDLNENFNLNDEVKKSQQIVDGVSGNLNGILEGNKSLDMNVTLSDGVEDILERRGKSEKDFEGNGSDNGNLCRNEDSRDDFDLNARSSSSEWLNLNDGSDLHASPSKHANLERRGSIDLNLYVNADFDENLAGGDVSCSQVEIKKREWDFDLNLEVNDVHGDTNNNGGEEIASSGMGEAIIDKVCDEAVMDQICDEAVIDQVCEEAAMDQVDDNVEGLRDKTMESELEDGNLQEVRIDIKEELPKDSYSSGGDVTVEASLRVSDLNCVNDGNLVNIDVKDVSSEAGPQTIDGCQGNSEGQCKQRGGRRKKRKVLDGVNTPDTVLRRSTRRGIVQKTTPIASSDISSPVASVVTDEKQVAYDGSDMPVGLPYKLQLPPSSKNLNLDDIPILDLFSIYSCLRSFSTLLFLSPFELDEFVAALKCKSPTILFDNIHLSVLQTLRKHLEDLSNEGSESASSCLRSLNWDMLDLITWPIFMVEYLLIHGSGLKPGVDLCHLKLLKNDYYKLPTGIKIEILRCLCDDMIEVEAIRSEINRRSLAAEPEILRDRSLKSEVYKKKKISANASINSCQSEDTMGDTADWNSDECCLCKMDGSLICCDGCPAAYHLKCVGIANDLLPEGDWFCPECAIDRHKSWMKTQKSLRGAEFLGVDPHGRTYFSSYGYLLVSDSRDTESSVSYYHKNDLDVVIEALRSSYSSYTDILVAIYKHWDITFTLNGKINKSVSLHCTNGYYGNFCHEGAKSTNLFEAEATVEGPTVNKSALDSKLNSSVQDIQKHQATVSNGYEFRNQAKVSGKFSSGEDSSLLHPCLDGMQEGNTRCAGLEHPLSTSIGKGDVLEVENDDGYSNFYSFAQTASLVADEFMRKSSEKDKIKEKSTMSEEEIIAAQMKIILRKTSNFCWPLIQNINAATQKEKCGWCFPCRVSSDEWDCLFKTNNGRIEEGLAVDVLGLQLKSKGKGHLKDVICQILSIENRLQGLLLGPWLNSHHSKLWREGLLAFDFNSVKHLLLMIESNLRHPAISAEWFKYVDSVNTLGSASLYITSSLRGTKHGISRKRARFSDSESNASSNGSSGLSMFWWRGGQLSRRIFNWKVLPRSLVSKAARQAGCTKIPGIAYPEGSEWARRSRSIAWRAAVEASTSVEQLAFQELLVPKSRKSYQFKFWVREFYSNVRWYDVENTHPLPTVEKELRKSIRLFKKVIVRRKSVEGDLVKYLLDFGKRRVLPDVVKKHGVMLEDSSNERKRYWLNETYVPLHLVKNFEEKRIARRANEVKPKIAELGIVKSFREKGFAYLFSRADKLDLYQCGRCNKVVPVREAVSCRYCQGIFHKKHVKKYVESVAAKCTYTCHSCWDGISMKTNGKRGKNGVKGGKLHMARGKKPSSDQRGLRLKNRKKVLRAGKQAQTQNKSKVPTDVPLRRSARQAKYSSLQKKKQDKKVGGSVKRKKIKSRKGTPKKRKRETSLQKKRTLTCHSFWLNGLFLSRKPGDERVTLFREKKLLLLTPRSFVNHDKPKCNLCSETEHASVLNYIACQNCGVWFHGDAFGLDQTKIDKLIGFRCHICRKRMPPVCPHQMNQKADILEVSEVRN
ncbi:DDT domain-containing protein PTM isoform X4 [Benincasa hispida]|uniref:DDT domain-containing protein PTM isoform X4 n=1 Tax=Benincasa hispida TaxID=102211 RepID=UPI00190167F7|nr:DDT domain-containing protein PTM isoform X4 [Benincasa hispida]